MIETKLTFFKVQPECGTVEATELRQPHLGEAPEVLNPVDVRLAFHELAATVIHPVMLLVAQVYQATVTLPAIRVDDAAQGHLALQNGRQYRPGTVGHNLRVDLPATLEQSKDGHFLKSSPSPPAPDAASAEITLVNLHRSAQRRLGFAERGDALPEMPEIKVDRVAVQAGELGCFSGFHIQTKEPQQEPEFPRRNARPPETPVSPCHHWLYIAFSWA